MDIFSNTYKSVLTSCPELKEDGLEQVIMLSPNVFKKSIIVYLKGYSSTELTSQENIEDCLTSKTCLSGPEIRDVVDDIQTENIEDDSDVDSLDFSPIESYASTMICTV